MADDTCPLPWTPQQWASLRAVVREAARKSRVASTFLPLAGPVACGDSTVPSNWIERRATGSADPAVANERLEIRAGKTLQLVTVACNLHLRGSEVADPDLDAVKSLLRRAGEVIGRVEDAIVFYGLPDEPYSLPGRGGSQLIVKPEIYTISGGRDFIGLMQSPETHLGRVKPVAKGEGGQAHSDSSENMTVTLHQQSRARDNPNDSNGSSPAPIVDAVIAAVQKLESHGHFGPFATVLGHELFRLATTPTNPSLVLPTDRIMPFLEGGPLLRSGTLVDKHGVVVALGGSPVELVLGSDIDIDYLQRTLEPRYVIRVYERFVVRIKELDAVCRIEATT